MKLISQFVLVAATLAAIAGGLFLLFRDSSPGGVEIVLPTATPAATLKVFVSGAVRRPDVYVVNEGDRLADVVEVAGGPTEEADLDAVNLAVRVRDEDHWHIPRIGESSPRSTAQQPGRSDLIDVNSADMDLLKTLPGIGEERAKAIIRYRDANGVFTSVQELLAVRGIGPKTFEDIRHLVYVR